MKRRISTTIQHRIFEGENRDTPPICQVDFPGFPSRAQVGIVPSVPHQPGRCQHIHATLTVPFGDLIIQTETGVSTMKRHPRL